MEVIETLQNLLSLTFTTVGKVAVVGVLSSFQNLEVIIRLAQHTKEGLAEGKKDMKKSGVRAYACELLLLVARISDRLDYLAHFSPQLLALGKQDETSKLHELISWCL